MAALPRVAGRALVACAALWAGAFLVAAAPRVGTPEDEPCLRCHTRASRDCPAPDGPELDAEQLALSPHAPLGCRACHPGIDARSHPDKPLPKGASKARGCRDCHDAEQLRSPPVHGRLLERAVAPACTECHVPHRMRRVRDWKPHAPMSMYCLTCHQRNLAISLRGGEFLRLTISEVARGRTVHLGHQCPDCHPEFSKIDHPIREIADRRAFARERAALCGGCHPEQARLYEGSPHSRLMRFGGGDAPVCTDCHSAHAVEAVAALRLHAGEPCRRCHQRVFETFARSGHGQAGAAGHPEAPLCTNCHRAHDPAYDKAPERINAACLECHGDAPAAHRGWLPEVEVHFRSVSCPACHAPAPASRVALTVLDVIAGRTVPRLEIADAAGSTYEDILARSPAETGDLAAWSEIVREMNRRDGGDETRFVLRIEAAEGSEVHVLGERKDACRLCARCHKECLELIDRALRGPR